MKNSASKKERCYTGRDVAFLIPTKDRHEKVKKLLNSLANQTVLCGRVIVVDGGKSVQDVVMSFSDTLPVEYYECRPPGQIRQRNEGLSFIDNRTPLVGFLDDDIVLEPKALESMISFWNRCDPDTAGVSFNIINIAPERRSWLECFLGISAPQPGRVLRCGMTTSVTNVLSDVRTQYLCGGATVWRWQILKKFPQDEIDYRWAIGEDVLFSYPIGKRYPLYVCAVATVLHEHEMDYVSRHKYRFHGYSQTIWLFYIVKSNEEFSTPLLLWSLFVRIVSNCAIGILTLNVSQLDFSVGQIKGTIKGLKTLISRKDMKMIFHEE